VLPQAVQPGRGLRGEVVAVQVLLAAGQVGVGSQQLPTDEPELAVVGVEVSVDFQLPGTAHGQELTAPPQTRVVICTQKQHKSLYHYML